MNPPALLIFAVTFNTLIVIHNITKQFPDFYFICRAYVVTTLLPVAVAGVLAKLVFVISDYNTITVSIDITIVNEGMMSVKQILTYFIFTSSHNCSSFTFLTTKIVSIFRYLKSFMRKFIFILRCF